MTSEADAQAQAAQERGGPAQGLAALVAAFLIWGLLPLYLRVLRHVAPLQLMAHRLVFCCVSVLLFLAVRRQLGSVRQALADSRTRTRLLASALLISINWLVYVWAIATGRVIESSLGYFINPLVNVLLGVVLLRERLSRAQWLAVCLAGIAVLYLTWVARALPWVALALALSFGSYGLIRKTIAVDAMTGLASETLLAAPLGAAYLALCQANGTGALRADDPWTTSLLVLCGPITAVPLFLFAYGARRVRYATVGVVQYLGPSLQLTFGVLVFKEPFPAARAAGYVLIWLALAIYAGDGLLRYRR